MDLDKRLYTLQAPHGTGKLLFAWQHRHGMYLATAGGNHLVHIYNRLGAHVHEANISGSCCGLEWDSSGDVLAAISDKHTSVLLWETASVTNGSVVTASGRQTAAASSGASGGRVRQLDSGLRDQLTVLAWAPSSALLAVGTVKGNLMIYSHRTSRRIPVVGKHTRRVTGAVWSEADQLVLISEDRTVTISDQHGDTLRTISLKGEPSLVRFRPIAETRREGGNSSTANNTLSMVISKKTFYFANIRDTENHREFALENRYGSIVQYEWASEELILFGYSSGFMVAVSSQARNAGTIIYEVQNHKQSLTAISINTDISKAASCGENVVKVHELQQLKDVCSVLVLDDEKTVDNVQWSPDGQLMTVVTSGGAGSSLHVFLSSLPMLSSTSGTRVAVLSSLREVTVKQCVDKKAETRKLAAPVEPSVLGLGPFHLMICMNNRSWVFALQNSAHENTQVGVHEYIGTVVSAHLNMDYASVLCSSGQLQLHLLDTDDIGSEERESRLFPAPENANMKITSHALTAEFLVFSTDTGHVQLFYIGEWTMVGEFRHVMSVLHVQPNASATRVVLIDEQHHCLLLNTVTDHVQEVPECPRNPLGVLWDVATPLPALTRALCSSSHGESAAAAVAGGGGGGDPVFIVWNSECVATYVTARVNIEERTVTALDRTKLVSSNQRPLILYNGEMTLQTAGGRLTSIILSSHEMSIEGENLSESNLVTALNKNITLRRYREAWQVAAVLDSSSYWHHLAESCLQQVDVQMALTVYKHIGDVASVWGLEQFSSVEERRLLCGHICSFLGRHDQAQAYYLSSSEPQAALQMRCDLMQWHIALQLATKLDTNRVPDVCRQYASQLENNDEFQQSLVHYERALAEIGEQHSEEHELACRAGVARCSIQCGDIRKGVSIATESDSKSLKKECAEILEKMKQYSEAAGLFEAAECYNQAAHNWIKLKHWPNVGALLPHINSIQIHAVYAKAREAEGRYQEALAAYEAAQDADSMVRVLLERLNSPQQAVAVVKRSRSITAAKLVARFFIKVSDPASAMQFLVISKCIEEAFTLAQKYGLMDEFADIIGDDGRIEDYKSVAVYYENTANSLQAGKFYFKAGEYHKAMKLLLESAHGAHENEALRFAIELVAQSNSDAFAKQLINFLLASEAGAEPKDPKYLFLLYMARRMYTDAAKTAVIIANQEQKSGSYRNARDVLYGMCQELSKHKTAVPKEMAHIMMLLHSYLLARIYIKKKNHRLAAQLLIRVADNISQFPAHTASILTSAVIQSERAGLRRPAFRLASMLLQDEQWRSSLDSKYRRQVETLVRRGLGGASAPDTDSAAEEEGELTPCPMCGHPTASMRLQCDSCRRRLPYCVVTAHHVTTGEGRELTRCPHCQFPAALVEMTRICESDETCPLCNAKSIDKEQLIIVEDAAVFLPLIGEE